MLRKRKHGTNLIYSKLFLGRFSLWFICGDLSFENVSEEMVGLVCTRMNTLDMSKVTVHAFFYIVGLYVKNMAKL